ncbi:PqqD family protein [Thermodesulfobacteriota bacterium]
MMAYTGLHEVPRKSTDLVSRLIAGELVMIPLRQSPKEVSRIYAINEVGGRIWDLLDGSRSLGEILECLLEEYEVSRVDAETSLLGFLEELKRIGAVEAEEGGTATVD